MSDDELELLAPWNEIVKAEIERRGLTGAFKHIQFNVELVADQNGAPSTDVDRRRASA